MKGLDSKILVLTGPRGVGKNHNLDFIINHFKNKIVNIPQISYREKRLDDDENYIKIVTQEEFDFQKPEMLVYNDKYGILNNDVKNAFDKGLIPAFILGWKEILKLRKKGLNSIILNITYPYNELNNGLDKNIENMILERLDRRGISVEAKNKEIERIIIYMKIFFNNPKFQKFFDYNLISKDNGKNLESMIKIIIEKEFNL